MSIDPPNVARARVLLVDNFEPFRRFVHSLVADRLGLEVVGQATDGLEAVRKSNELRPDLILLDVHLPTLNGFEIVKRIRHSAPTPKILFLSLEFSADLVQEALRLGARGFVDKRRAASDLSIAIEAVLEGRQFVSIERRRTDRGQ